MGQIVNKKQFGMYTISIDDDGTLQIQAPTLFKPITIEAHQTQELARWLAEIHQISPQPVAEVPNTAAEFAAGGVPVVEEPAAPEASPEEIAQNAVRDVIATTRSQYPASLAPENRDRFIEQLIRTPILKPLVSQGKISRKQILLWVEQQLGISL